jgi:hypothetical protein
MVTRGLGMSLHRNNGKMESRRKKKTLLDNVSLQMRWLTIEIMALLRREC